MPLSPEQLYRHCDLSKVDFSTTDDFTSLTHLIGQQRALEAINFGVGMQHEGYNLYVSGSIGVGKQTLIDQVVGAQALERPTPSDWCYVQNFAKPYQPIVLQLAAGKGSRLKKDMQVLIELLLEAIPSTFQGEAYQKRLDQIRDDYQTKEAAGLSELAERTKADGVMLFRTPQGFTLGPMQDGKPLGPKEFAQLPEERQKELQEKVEKYNDELKNTLQAIPRLQEEGRQQIKELNMEFAHFTIDPLIERLAKNWHEDKEVMSYIAAVHENIVENFEDFFKKDNEDNHLPKHKLVSQPEFLPYQVNVLVDNAEQNGAPIYYENNPTHQNLIGRIENIAMFGMLSTNFTLIKPGALHKANGGFLVLDALKLIRSPYSYDVLKRVLRTRQLRIESLQELLSLTTTTSLEPQPIPLDVKIILYGERMLFYMLNHYDPEFSQLFKVNADFNEEMFHNEESVQLYCQLIATLLQHNKLKAMDKSAVSATIEHNARMVSDAEKLSLNMTQLSDLLSEADYWARQQGDELISDSHVQQAINSRLYRSDQIRERLHESIDRDIILIDTEGEKTGQVNGLSIIQLGENLYGKPSRITATARLGNGKLIDIERETELGGSIHSKGVMILGAYIANRYAREIPLSLSATLVFEQSYGMVDGDSASAAELCTLLSAIADVPLTQTLAITGSVNQHGQIQAIGGVNEKIEGFFDICVNKGLKPGQGVVIPKANVQHLMLRQDVIAAVKRGEFSVHTVSHIDELLQLLSGTPAGELQNNGEFTTGSFNHRVQQRLSDWEKLNRKRDKHQYGDDHGKRH
jgi:lon-related putative ATP-dependent protease